MKMLSTPRHDANKDEIAAAVAEFKAKGGKITHCPPSTLPGSEISRSTHKTVMKMRADFRKRNTETKKKARLENAKNLKMNKLNALRGEE